MYGYTYDSVVCRIAAFHSPNAQVLQAYVRVKQPSVWFIVLIHKYLSIFFIQNANK